MPEKTDLNITPYYDDYNEDKKFHKVLFRASRPLQARELTQSQSILQNQIERFGDHFFKEGSIVQGAQSDIDMEVYYVKVQSANPNSLGTANAEDYRTNIHNKFLQGKTSGVIAQVITSSAQTSDDSMTLFVKYLTQGTDTANSFTFLANEELNEVTLDANGAATDAASNNDFQVRASTDTPNGRGSIAKISEGIVFIRGFFCKVDAQEIILEKYSGAPSYRIGLAITESLITSAADSSLLDNATGTNNENAAGADRLKIALTLSKVALTSTDDVNFIELGRVNNGIIELQINKPMYNHIEHTLARRTFDANGDFVVRQFTHNLREHLDDTTNRGYYTSAYGGKEDRLIMQVSPGKAYVKGYEIEKIGTTPLDINKARTTVTLENANTPVRLGNHLRVKNAHSLPDFGNEGATLDPFKPMKLFPSVNAVAGTENSEDHIGFARARDITLLSGTTTATSGSINKYDSTSIFEVSMFDVKMFTKITYSAHSGTASVGDLITGATSGATGILAYDNNSNAIYLHDVIGSFIAGEAISSTGNGTFALSTSQNTAVRNYNIDRVRSVAQEASDSNNETFTADAVADADRTLTGTVTFAGSTSVTGFGTRFTSELKEGDIIYNPGGSQEVIVSSVTSDTALTLTGSATAFTGNAIRRRVKIYNQDQTAQIFAWPRNWVSNFSPDSITIRRQEIVTVASGSFTLDTGSNGTFGSINTDNFTLAVIEQAAGSPQLANGENLDIESLTTSVSSAGSAQQLTVSGINSADNGALIKATFTVTITNPTNRDKTLRKARCLKVGNSRASGGFYGTCYDDRDISLGVSDAFKIRGIYEGVDGTPLPPNATINDLVGTFTVHETVVGQTSDARAVLIDYNGGSGATSYWYYTNNNQFVNGETLVGATSGATATINSVSQGSPNITNRFFFDDGQRDGFYDLAKLTRKSSEPAPNNPILIVFDFFTSSGGDFFDVNSYSNIAYKDIPVYSPNRVDLGGLEPDGTFELSDAVDFRPVVGHVLGSSTFANTDADLTSVLDLSNSTSGAYYSPFSYENGRSFKGSRTGISASNANTSDTAVNQSSVVGDISFYVGRIDRVFLHKSGAFEVATGIPALTPTKPKAIDDCIELFELNIPPYTLNLKDIRVRSKDHRRYTMADIGKINNRVTNLERITSLSLLEKDVQSKQILDADGFDRFKSGFLVDNFRGHKVGDVNHPDYSCSIDPKKGVLRPKSYSQFFDLTLNTGTSTNYQKTGDLITLPYSEVSYVNQSKASRQLNVNPYHVFAFIGNMKLTPSTDVWQDTDTLPEVRINREGNFDAVLAGNDIGTVWNNWQTSWVGEPTAVSSEVESTSSGSWSGDPAQGGEWVAGTQITREITETPESQTRTGITTSVVEDFVETRNDRIVSVNIIPFIRSKTIEIDVQNLKPSTNHFFFFDGINVNKYIRPYSSSFSQDGGITVSSGVKTNGNGRLRAYFEIPNSSAQRFPTGSRLLKVTSSSFDLMDAASHADAIYTAQGLLQTSQTEIVSTRNGRVLVEFTSGERQITRRGESLNFSPTDEIPPQIDTVEPPVTPTPEVVQIIESSPVQPPQPDPVLPDPPPVLPNPQPRECIPGELDWEFFEDLDLGGGRGRPDFPRRPRRCGPDGKWIDPLAQSFLVEADTGLFATSIDVYFATKDDTLPVNIEIRNMVNGYPGQIVLPFSEVTKNPADVNTSADGSTATTFTFQSPVFLEGNTEYCFVVLSNSNKYEVFTSRMGEVDLITNQVISGQPYAGSLFLSQNASTWTAEQTDDMKFNFKIAKFNTAKIPVLNFENGDLPAYTLQENPIETFSGQTYVKVYNYSHGMYSTASNVILTGATGDKEGSITGISNPSLASGTLPVAGSYDVSTTTGGSGSDADIRIVITGGVGSEQIDSVKIIDPGYGYTSSDTLTITNFGSQTNSVTIDIDTVEDTIGGIPVSAINATFTAIANIEIDSFTVIPDLSSFDFVSGYSALASTVAGGRSVTSTRNYYFDAIHTMIPNLYFKRTLISTSIYGTYMPTPEGVTGGTAYQKQATGDFVSLNDNVFLSTPKVVASAINETNEMSSSRSFTCKLQMRSLNPNISPVIDVSSIGALAIMNRINNIDSSSDVQTGTTYIASTEPEGDNNKMIYCTRKVNLKTPASAIRVNVDLFRPSNTDVKLMYKILKNDDTTPWDDLGWEYFNTDGSPDVSISNDARNFKEYEYTAENLPEFGAFAIKIVGQATNTCAVPMASALRCVALST